MPDLRRSGLAAATLLALGPLGTSPASADPLTQFGTAMKYGLPAAAAICAIDQGRFEDFALRAAVQGGVVLALKSWFDGTDLGRRPTGAGRDAGRGFPSGHAAAAGFGAGDLAGNCLDDQPEGAALIYGAAGLASYSRVEAGAHTPAQAMAGTLIGVSFGAASFGIGGAGAGFQLGLRF